MTKDASKRQNKENRKNDKVAAAQWAEAKTSLHHLNMSGKFNCKSIQKNFLRDNSLLVD